MSNTVGCVDDVANLLLVSTFRLKGRNEVLQGIANFIRVDLGLWRWFLCFFWLVQLQSCVVKFGENGGVNDFTIHGDVNATYYICRNLNV